MNINFSVNYITHAFILFSFLSIFFIFYMSKIIKGAFDTEMSDIIENIFNSINNKIPVNSFNKFNLNALINIFSKPDEKSGLHNDLLIKSLIIVNIILWIGLISVICILKSFTTDLDMTHILIENAIIFSIVGVVEYLFFTAIALKFVPVEPSFIKKQAIEILKKKN